MARALTLKIVGDAASALRAFKQTSTAAGQLDRSHGQLAKGLGGLKTAALGVSAAVTTGLVVAFKEGFDEIQAGQSVMAQTEAVLKSTGGQAGMTKKEIADLAAEMQKATGIDDNLVQAGENLLLTFTGIRDEVGKGNDIFTQATGIMADMSVALGQDMKSSAIQLGKALNDPVKGVTALRRVGVSFTEAQLEQIKAMVESGDVMGAQKLILSELKTEFGGSAEAAGKTFAGSLKKLRENFQDLAAKGLEAVMPLFEKLVGWAESAVEWFESLSPSMKKLTLIAAGVAAALGPVIAIGGKLGSVASGIGGLMSGLGGLTSGFGGLSGILAAIGGPVTLVVAGVAALAAGFTVLYLKSDSFRKWVDENLLPVFKALWELIKEVAKALIEIFAAAWKALKPILMPIINWIKDNVGAWLKSMTEGLKMWADIFRGDWSAAWEHLKNAAKAIWDRIKAAFGELFDGLKNIAARAWEAIKNALGPAWEAIKGVFKTAVNSIRDWFAGRITAFGNAARDIANAIKNKFGEGWGLLKQFSGKLRELITWMGDKLTDFGSAAFNIGKRIVERIIGAIGDLGRKIWDNIKGGLGWLWDKISSPSQWFGGGGRVQSEAFAKGGRVRGGRRGRDSVAAMLTPGEVVLTRAQQDVLGGPRYFQQLFGARFAPAGFAQGGTVGNGWGGIGPAVSSAGGAIANSVAKLLLKVLEKNPPPLVKALGRTQGYADYVDLLNLPYVWGGGHGGWDKNGPFDCSGFVSHVLHYGLGALSSPQTTYGLAALLPKGLGKYVSVFVKNSADARASHTFMSILGQQYESGGVSGGGGSKTGRSTGGFGGYHVTGYANGGVSPGGLALVGENGPELVGLPRGSRVFPGLGCTIVVNVNVAGSIHSDREVAEVVRRELIGLQRRNLTTGLV